MSGFQVISIGPLEVFLRGSLLAKLTQLKTSEGGFIETYSYSFYLFNPGKTMLGADSSQPD
jgi:hypothetical protein